VPDTQQSPALGKDGRRWRRSPFCRVPTVRHSAKIFVFFAFSLPSVVGLALGKDLLCRVPKEFCFFFLFAPKNFLQPSYSTCNYLFKFSPFFRPLAIFS
jgi:hypothetical protein